MKSVGLIYGAAGAAGVAARQLGLDVKFNYETRGDCYLKTFKRNFSGAEILDNSVLWPEVKKLASDCDLLIGQPDCKNYSNLQTKIKDKQSFIDTQLYGFLKLIQFILPDMWIVENLKAGINAANEYLLINSKFEIDFNSEDNIPIIDYYNLTTIEVNTLDFLPQSRNRFFIIGIKKPKTFRYKQSILKDQRTVRDVLKDLESERSHKTFMNHRVANHSPERIKGFSKLKVGESYYGTQNNRKLDQLKHAGTITSHCSAHVHYKFPRTLTVRENARIQGFPDNFEFMGNNTQCQDMVGKSISPPVIKYILKQII